MLWVFVIYILISIECSELSILVICETDSCNTLAFSNTISLMNKYSKGASRTVVVLDCYDNRNFSYNSHANGRLQTR